VATAWSAPQSRMDDGLLESTKARRDLGPLPPRSVMMIEDGDANDLDFIIWY